MCPQMATDKKWRYQVDLYAMAMSLHLIIFGDYAKVGLSTYIGKTYMIEMCKHILVDIEII